MTSPSRSTAVRIGAIALATAFSAAIATPAQAQDDVSLRGYVTTTFGNQFEAGFPETKRQAGKLTVVAWSEQTIEIDTLHAVLTIDESFEGLSLETDDERCTAAGKTLTCDQTDHLTGFSAEFGFFLVVAPEVQPGDGADYEIAMKADDHASDTLAFNWEFAEAGSTAPDFVVNAHDTEVTEPGGTANPRVEFQYNGEQGYEDFYFRLGPGGYYPQQGYLSTAARYSNCGVNERGTEYCILKGFSPEPGQIYELSPGTPVDITPAEDTPGPMRFPARIRMEAITDEDLIDSIDFYDADTELVFAPSDVEDIVQHPDFDVTTAANPFDLDMADAGVEGAPGDDATYDIAYTNDSSVDAIIHLPPWDTDVFDFYSVAIQLPTGVEVTAGDPETGFFTTPDRYSCRNVHIYALPSYDDIVAAYGIEDLDLLCELGDVVQAGATATFRLPVEITSDTPATDGRSAVLDPSLFWSDQALAEYEMTRDDFPIMESDLENNTAVLSLNTKPPGTLPETGTSFGFLGGLGALILTTGAAVAVLTRYHRLTPDSRGADS